MEESQACVDLPGSGCAISPNVVPWHSQSASVVELGQNFPNPHAGETTVPFRLTIPADVRLIILDALGRKVAGVSRKGSGPGVQHITLNLTGLGLPAGSYEYRLEASTRTGVFQQSKLMNAELG